MLVDVEALAFPQIVMANINLVARVGGTWMRRDVMTLEFLVFGGNHRIQSNQVSGQFCGMCGFGSF